LTPAFSNHLVILRYDFLLDHSSGFVIDRMRDVFVGAVFAFLAGHRHKISGGATYNLEVADHEAVIQSDSYVSPEFFFIHRKDPNFSNLHRDPLLKQPVEDLAVDLTGFWRDFTNSKLALKKLGPPLLSATGERLAPRFALIGKHRTPKSRFPT